MNQAYNIKLLSHPSSTHRAKNPQNAYSSPIARFSPTPDKNVPYFRGTETGGNTQTPHRSTKRPNLQKVYPQKIGGFEGPPKFLLGVRLPTVPRHLPPMAITQKPAARTQIPTANSDLVLHDVPFHSPRNTPSSEEKKTALDIRTANEM